MVVSGDVRRIQLATIRQTMKWGSQLGQSDTFAQLASRHCVRKPLKTMFFGAAQVTPIARSLWRMIMASRPVQKNTPVAFVVITWSEKKVRTATFGDVSPIRNAPTLLTMTKAYLF